MRRGPRSLLRRRDGPLSWFAPVAIASREVKITMALHRDIYWVGKQWAVTGYGIQACNQKQKGQFDIEASRLWDDGVQDAVRGLSWVNMEDFEKAITAARKYYPEPPRKTPPPAPPVTPPIHVAPAPEPQPS